MNSMKVLFEITDLNDTLCFNSSVFSGGLMYNIQINPIDSHTAKVLERVKVSEPAIKMMVALESTIRRTVNPPIFPD